MTVATSAGACACGHQRGFLGHAPLPRCLPKVPPCAEPEAVMEEGPDARCAG